MANFYLFDVTNEVETKVKDTDFLEFYPNISREMSWSNLKPYIRQAWNNHITQFLGKDLIITLENVSETGAEIVKLRELIKQALALYTIYLAYPQNNQFITDGTVSQNVSDKTQPISQWAFKNARWSQLIAAEKALDVALTYIIEESIDGYDGSKYTHPWIKDTTTLLEFVRVNGIRAFLNIRTYFDSAVSELKSIIGCDTYDDLFDNKSEESYAAAVKSVQMYIAHKSLELSIPRLLTFVEGNSIIFLSSADGISEGYGIYTKSNAEDINALLISCREDAGRAINDLKNTMSKNPETFSVWKDYLKSIEFTSDFVVTRDVDYQVVGGVMTP